MTGVEKCWGIYTGRLFSSETFSRINTPTFLKPSHSSQLPAYEDGTECSETSVYKIQAPGNYPEESIQHRVILYLRNSVYFVLLNPKYCSAVTYDVTDALYCCNKENFAIYLFQLNRFLT
jgi:hypothetical protein